MLELRDVSHVYVNDQGVSLAVEGLNAAIQRGEFVSLIGPSGCGKTTILSMLAGLFPPSRGEVLVDGNPLAGPTAKIGYMLQQDYLFPWRTIQENALTGLEIMGQKTPAAVSRAAQLLEEMGLGGMASRYPHELSGGMRQRVALVRTLAPAPEVLLLDEPFSALDMHIKLQLEDLVQETLQRLGKTAVLVTHDLGEAAAMSDRIFLLGRRPGRIRYVFDVPPELRALAPTAARRHPRYQQLFDTLWEHLDSEVIEQTAEEAERSREGEAE
ncbi:ABC transporter ATP-binding protein [Paenibacillaceae bacterium]|nr:ABC transporter ATP-binding protein [Paenibacillaceae bacterium]